MALIRLTQEVADRMGLSLINIHDGINAGTIKGQKISDRIFMIDDSLVPETKQLAPIPDSNAPPTPRQRLETSNLELDAIRKQQEVDSVKLNYENFKQREKSISDRESELIKGTNQLLEDRNKLTADREDLLAKYETHKTEYDTLMAAIKTREQEAERIMTEAIAKKSEADNIIKSQTESEKLDQTKQNAYSENMEETIGLLVDIYRLLKRQEDSKVLDMAVILHKDYLLLSRLHDKKVNPQTSADIISVDCDRLLELCEYLQDSKKDYSGVLKFLLDSVNWIQSALIISWQPSDKAILR